MPLGLAEATVRVPLDERSVVLLSAGHKDSKQETIRPAFLTVQSAFAEEEDEASRGEPTHPIVSVSTDTVAEDIMASRVVLMLSTSDAVQLAVAIMNKAGQAAFEWGAFEREAVVQGPAQVEPQDQDDG